MLTARRGLEQRHLAEELFLKEHAMNLHWNDIAGVVSRQRTPQSSPAFSQRALRPVQSAIIQPTQDIWLHGRADYEHPYVLKWHRASKDHLDLRLCIHGIALSWAMYSMPSHCPERRCTAIQVEDHLRKYITFEGVHPKGKRGAGPTIVVDQGSWQLLAECPYLDESLRSGRLRFRINGDLLRGIWLLVREKGSFPSENPRWTLTKEPDEYAVPKNETIAQDLTKLRSCRTRLTLEEMEQEWNQKRRTLRACGSLFGD
jgi:DNA ligase D-like protein (predicted 3'-phosphoesterase)